MEFPYPVQDLGGITFGFSEQRLQDERLTEKQKTNHTELEWNIWVSPWLSCPKADEVSVRKVQYVYKSLMCIPLPQPKTVYRGGKLRQETNNKMNVPYLRHLCTEYYRNNLNFFIIRKRLALNSTDEFMNLLKELWVD